MKHKKKITYAIILILLTINLFVGCIQSPSDQTVIIQGKAKRYLTIKDALKDANNGDKIIVGKGIFNESILIDKSISLIGKGKNITIINGNLTGDVINILADHVTIIGLTIQNSGNQSAPDVDAGIDIRSNNCIIKNNTIMKNNNFGIYIHSSTKNNIIQENEVFQNTYGITLENATKNNISLNKVTNNTEYGIYLRSRSNKNLIYNNYISKNDLACRIKSSEKNIVKYNTIINNERGLYFCCGAKNNTAFKNNFEINVQYNGNDYIGNNWDNGIMGNYWDDYQGIDNNSDGIGDTPYIIYENTSQDNYPLIEKIYR